jgi:hypothetical protein
VTRDMSSNAIVQLSLGIRGEFVPGPQRIPKSTDAQVFYIKYKYIIFAYSLYRFSHIF